MGQLETERLHLRRFELADAPRARELAGDVEIARTTLHIPHPYPEGAAEAWIEATGRAADDGRAYAFAMQRKSDDALIGCMSIGVQRDYERAELAYWVGRPYWGKGYATEAAARVVQFGFEVLGLNRIYAFAMTSNPASSKVMQKIGMTYEGTLRQHVRKWDEFHDLVSYGILRSEYTAKA